MLVGPSKPESVNKFANQIKKIFTPLRIKKQNTVLFHLDEKWSDINISTNFIINLFEEITANRKINLIVTNGKKNTGVEINSWIKNNWKTSKKEDVKNKDLWLELYNLNQSLNIKWNWVKAHAGNPLNEEVDLLAKKAANLD